ncbi:hypothetical protein KQX54_003566 [Cotesia glomerata]|uniref:Uncharacterized protein n=1 Tax=Cotesia glomerata TaxID=32391 RepID=A0AAV7IN39_COTGL|nr:hypothetical protein KQX54_003566 [Cotesia glomerata]
MEAGRRQMGVWRIPLRLPRAAPVPSVSDLTLLYSGSARAPLPEFYLYVGRLIYVDIYFNGQWEWQADSLDSVPLSRADRAWDAGCGMRVMLGRSGGPIRGVSGRGNRPE